MKYIYNVIAAQRIGGGGGDFTYFDVIYLDIPLTNICINYWVDNFLDRVHGNITY